MLDLSFHKTPSFIPSLFASLKWKVVTKTKEVYLTFDDGPIPILSEEILNILKQNKIKATFFCVGENVEKNPEIFEKIIEEGHSIGNHTYNHLKAWHVSTNNYMENVTKAQNALEMYGGVNKRLFRPPYGQITPKLNRKLIEDGYEVIMWDILSKDYLSSLNIDKAFQKCSKQTGPGSIIVFHDNIKARNNVLNLLPMYITKLLSEGYHFKTL